MILLKSIKNKILARDMSYDISWRNADSYAFKLNYYYKSHMKDFR